MDWLFLLELIATVFGLLNVYLLTRENIWAWPAGLIMVSIYIIIFWHSKLYSDVILHVIYVFLNIYGWWNWTRSNDEPALPVIRINRTKIILWSLLIAIGTSVWGNFMDKNTDASFAYFDAFTTVASLVAQYMLAKKIIENWVLWIVVDIVAINIYFLKGLHVTSGLYFLFLLLCIQGLISWNKSMREQNNLFGTTIS